MNARTRGGVTYPVATGDVIQRYLWLFGVWEPHLTAFIHHRLAPGDVFIDVGANIGYYSFIASRLISPGGRVVAVEASPVFHQLLTAHAHVEGRDNIRAVNAAAADVPGQLTLYLERSTNLGGTTTVRPRTIESSFEIEAAPLASILTDTEIEAARLIKMDVEGAEAAVVRGMTSVLDRLRPDAEIVIEVTPRLLAKQGEQVDDVLNPFLRRGFNIYQVANDYDPASYPTALRKPIPPTRWRGPITNPTDLGPSPRNLDTRVSVSGCLDEGSSLEGSLELAG